MRRTEDLTMESRRIQVELSRRVRLRNKDVRQGRARGGPAAVESGGSVRRRRRRGSRKPEQ